MNIKLAIVVSLPLFLAACGGSSDSENDTNPGAGAGTGSGGGDLFNISTRVTGGGSLSPSSYSLASGESLEMEVLADEGSALTSISGCNGQLNNSETIYNISGLSGNCMVSAIFELTEDEPATSVEGNNFTVGRTGMSFHAYAIGTELEPLPVNITSHHPDSSSGSFTMDLDGLNDDAWVLVKATGGTQLDLDYLGEYGDQVPTPDAVLFGAATVSDWNNGANVSVLSDVAWRLTQGYVGRFPVLEVEARLDRLSSAFFISGAEYSYADIAYWDMSKRKAAIDSGQFSFEPAHIGADGDVFDVYSNGYQYYADRGDPDGVLPKLISVMMGDRVSAGVPINGEKVSRIQVSMFGPGSVSSSIPEFNIHYEDEDPIAIAYLDRGHDTYEVTAEEDPSSGVVFNGWTDCPRVIDELTCRFNAMNSRDISAQFIYDFAEFADGYVKLSHHIEVEVLGEHLFEFSGEKLDPDSLDILQNLAPGNYLDFYNGEVSIFDEVVSVENTIDGNWIIGTIETDPDHIFISGTFPIQTAPSTYYFEDSSGQEIAVPEGDTVIIDGFSISTMAGGVVRYEDASSSGECVLSKRLECNTALFKGYIDYVLNAQGVDDYARFVKSDTFIQWGFGTEVELGVGVSMDFMPGNVKMEFLQNMPNLTRRTIPIRVGPVPLHIGLRFDPGVEIGLREKITLGYGVRASYTSGVVFNIGRNGSIRPFTHYVGGVNRGFNVGIVGDGGAYESALNNELYAELFTGTGVSLGLYATRDYYLDMIDVDAELKARVSARSDEKEIEGADEACREFNFGARVYFDISGGLASDAIVSAVEVICRWCMSRRFNGVTLKEAISSMSQLAGGQFNIYETDKISISNSDGSVSFEQCKNDSLIIESDREPPELLEFFSAIRTDGTTRSAYVDWDGEYVLSRDLRYRFSVKNPNEESDRTFQMNINTGNGPFNRQGHEPLFLQTPSTVGYNRLERVSNGRVFTIPKGESIEFNIYYGLADGVFRPATNFIGMEFALYLEIEDIDLDETHELSTRVKWNHPPLPVLEEVDASSRNQPRIILDVTDMQQKAADHITRELISHWEIERHINGEFVGTVQSSHLPISGGRLRIGTRTLTGVRSAKGDESVMHRFTYGNYKESRTHLVIHPACRRVEIDGRNEWDCPEPMIVR